MPSTIDSFTGFIDRALLKSQRVGEHTLDLLGWFWAEDSATTELRLALKGEEPQIASLHNRPDVATRLPSSGHSAKSGFSVSLPVTKIQEEYEILLSATLENGRQITSVFKAHPTEEFQGIGAAYGTPFGSLDARKALSDLHRLKLRSFLRSNSTWNLEPREPPAISVIIPVRNQAATTLACLEALRLQSLPDLEIILIDNDSRDETSTMLSRMEGIRVIQNLANEHYVASSNQGAQRAQGEFLLFLNNDAFVLPGAIASALSTLRSDPTIGAVGAKLIRPDGKLQEAGAFVLPNGSTVAIGRGSDPEREKYRHCTTVDYCSGAFLLTAKSRFLSSGQFNPRFAPAYYEDVEYCIRLAKAGLRCVVDAGAEVLHVERGSAESDNQVDNLIERNRQIFLELYPDWKRAQNPLPTAPSCAAVPSPRILVVDDALPDSSKGQGLGRAALMFSVLQEFELRISFFAANTRGTSDLTSVPENIRLISRGLEESEYECLSREITHTDIILVSRPQNMELIQSILSSNPPLPTVPIVIYDAEGLQAKREILRLEVLEGNELTDDEIVHIVSNEIIVGKDANFIITASEQEASTFTDFGYSNVSVLGYGIDPSPSDTSFEEREGLLTIGPLLSPETPNADGLLWFVEQVLPWINKIMSREIVPLHAVGENHVDRLEELQSEQFQLFGFVQNLKSLYASHRIFIAPTRFSAGISLKVIEAAAAGIPIVATPLIANQLGWQDERDLLVGYNEQDFAAKCAALYVNSDLWGMLRENALKRIEEQFSLTSFKEKMRNLLLSFHCKSRSSS